VKKLIIKLPIIRGSSDYLTFIPSFISSSISIPSSWLLMLGDPTHINSTDQQAIFTGSFEVLESMDRISVSGNLIAGTFQEDFRLVHANKEEEKVTNKNTLRVNLDFSRTFPT